MMGAVSATAVAVGLTPAMANAASSQTYFIGFPDWLPIGEGATLPSDPVAINNAMVGAKDTNPLIAWGLGAANLQPVWVKYVDGVPVYTVPKIGQTGSHTEAEPLLPAGVRRGIRPGRTLRRLRYGSKSTPQIFALLTPRLMQRLSLVTGIQR